MATLKKFYDFPINAAKLDPKTTPFSQSAHALKYIGIVQSGVKPTSDQVEAVREGVEAYCRKTDDAETLAEDLAGIAKTWPEMKERFSKNAGLTQMMLDYGVNSRYFYQFLWLTGRKLFGVALALKDGLMMPVSGKRIYENVPPDDWAYQVAVWEGVFVARMQSDYACQSLLRRAKAIFDAGAGMAPAYSWLYDYPLGENGQKLILCDADARLADYVPMMLGDALAQRKATYVFGDACKVAPMYAGQIDVFRMVGVLSYLHTREAKLNMLRHAKNTLTRDGVIVLDEQILTKALIRSGITTLWPNDANDPASLLPAASQTAALDAIDWLAKQLDLKYVYLEDQCNGNPKCLTQVEAEKSAVVALLGNDVSVDMFDKIELPA